MKHNGGPQKLHNVLSYRSLTNQDCDDRIVSISQSYIHPVVRGKARKKAEFGAKIGVSLTGNKLAHVDHLEWDSYYEGHDLPERPWGVSKKRLKRTSNNFGMRLNAEKQNIARESQLRVNSAKGKTAIG